MSFSMRLRIAIARFWRHGQFHPALDRDTQRLMRQVLIGQRRSPMKHEPQAANHGRSDEAARLRAEWEGRT